MRVAAYSTDLCRKVVQVRERMLADRKLSSPLLKAMGLARCLNTRGLFYHRCLRDSSGQAEIDARNQASSVRGSNSKEPVQRSVTAETMDRLRPLSGLPFAPEALHGLDTLVLAHASLSSSTLKNANLFDSDNVSTMAAFSGE